METLYNGTSFRSRLEARWAVFYDALGIPYQYVREKMHPDGIFYPSHFLLPEQQLWITIKGSTEDGELIEPRRFEREAEVLSTHMGGEDVYTFYGQIPIAEDSISLDYGDADNDSAHRVYAFPADRAAEIGVDGGFDHFYAWCECPECGLLDVQYGGRAARNRCGCLPGDQGHNCGSPRLAAAYEAARQARAEGDRLVPGPSCQDRQQAAQRQAKKKHTQRRRAQFGRNYSRFMLSLINRDGYKCAVCGGIEDLTIDHVTPLSKGGSDDLDNLKIYCRPCNSAKGDRHGIQE